MVVVVDDDDEEEGGGNQWECVDVIATTWAPAQVELLRHTSDDGAWLPPFHGTPSVEELLPVPSAASAASALLAAPPQPPPPPPRPPPLAADGQGQGPGAGGLAGRLCVGREFRHVL